MTRLTECVKIYRSNPDSWEREVQSMADSVQLGQGYQDRHTVGETGVLCEVVGVPVENFETGVTNLGQGVQNVGAESLVSGARVTLNVAPGERQPEVGYSDSYQPTVHGEPGFGQTARFYGTEVSRAFSMLTATRPTTTMRYTLSAPQMSTLTSNCMDWFDSGSPMVEEKSLYGRVWVPISHSTPMVHSPQSHLQFGSHCPPEQNTYRDSWRLVSEDKALAVQAREVVIAEIESPVILGIDFLGAHKGVLDMRGGTLKVDGTVHICRRMGGMHRICRVSVAETVIMPAMSEMLIPRNIDGTPHFTQGIVEMSDCTLCDGNLMMARTVVNPTLEVLPLRVTNWSTEPQTLWKEMHMGTCEPVSVVVTLSPEGKLHNASKLPNRVCQMLDECRDGLAPDEQEMAECMLAEFVDDFSWSKDDLTVTDADQHDMTMISNEHVKLGNFGLWQNMAMLLTASRNLRRPVRSWFMLTTSSCLILRRSLEEWSSFDAPVVLGVDHAIQGVGGDGKDLSEASRDDIDSVLDEGGADFPAQLPDCCNNLEAPRYPRWSVRKRCLPLQFNDFEMM